jgi:ABC-type lipoprotein release transport system permease subunit
MILTLAWRNIWRNKRRSFITLSSIGFAVVFATMMMSVQKGSLDQLINNSVKFYTGHIQVQNPKYFEEKTINNSIAYNAGIIKKINDLQGVKVVSPRIESFGLASYGSVSKASMILGIEPDNEDKILNLSKKLRSGKMITSESKGILIAEGLSEYLKAGIGDTLVILGQGYHGSNAAGLFVIEGLLKFPNPVQNKQMICMPLKQAEWFYDFNNKLTSMAILLDDNKVLPKVETNLKVIFKSKNYAIVNWQKLIPDLIEMREMKFASTRIMIFILYSVIGFGMFGTFLMMASERMREFGILLAVGMKRRLLQLTTFLEILLLSSLGVIMGLAISSLLILYFYYNPIYLGSSYDAIAESYGIEMTIEFAFESTIIITQAFAVFIIAFILSFYPLLIIKKTKPVKAIREG